tara:strand:- start:198 stop:500 length:303 start_codon:yes stop_codon:yes gene_type:complete
MIIKHKKNLGKKEIVNNIKSIIGFSSNNIKKVSDDLIETIVQILIDQKKINIKNFGSFTVVYKKKREGRNPKTNENFTITSRNAIQFRPSTQLKQKINEK